MAVQQRVILLLTLSLMSFIPTLSYAAEPNWLRSFITNEHLSLNEIKQQADLFDCGLEDEDIQFCSDEVNYYTTAVFAQLWVENNSVNELMLTRDFSMTSYSNLQLSLRRDGYQIETVTMNGHLFDVKDKLSKNTIMDVDKELIIFLNSQPITQEKRLTWSKKFKNKDEVLIGKVIFESNKDGITLHFIHSAKR
ncbi:hypothetical protein BCU68_03300 [Vibrio sp. 10N.286.49.B3]|uniref:hypothetical protein n=1 Tax=Vibrio sp. 10N.286.49.B3 TaxID=1880855 RepID=UPI000C8488A0|nr:hypothetical protein [Vibrio sp. 10N.286.49.B3]PMH44541.1 hypothetical protein BCU68_03300 [Vibrio sp. 10N.286.49.B3]